MKPFLSAVFLTLSLGLFACPGPGDEPNPGHPQPDGGGALCVKDADCTTGKGCCGGVCVDLATDTENCGVCGNVCSAPNATSSCTQGVCGVDQCAEGFAHCNGDATDGCETDTRTDVANCGACNHACEEGETCTAGVCTSAYVYGYGGEVDLGVGYSEDVWRYSVTKNRFEAVATQGADVPGARSGHVGAFDRQGNRMFVWGGTNWFSALLDPDVWALDVSTEPATWKRISSGVVNPGGRINPCTGYDSANRVLYVFGGINDIGNSLNDFWKFDLGTETWTLIDDGSHIAPQVYINASCAYQPESERFVVFAGIAQDGSSAENDLWVRNVSGAGGWENLALQSTPSARMAARFFDGSSPLVLFGGVDFDSESGAALFPTDVSALTVAPTWEQQVADGQPGGPAGRFGHAAAVLNGHYYVFGGAVVDPTSGLKYQGDLWEYDPAAKSWTERVPNNGSNVPAGKVAALMVAPR